ncbi:MAG: SagB/ThcOx family dehydrogenase [Candidatus Moraniibacteriota bacterium]|nr:MAG: SagB/ThcOx family dehydrogenase [Candidatus Moranbacteria bacterium]
MKRDVLLEYFIAERQGIQQQLYKQKKGPKSYGRFEAIALPKPRPLSQALSDALFYRESVRDYDRGAYITLEQISDLLYWSVGILEPASSSRPERRVHPSGGAKFPLELYLVILKEGTVKRGVYHYHLANHTLEHLEPIDLDQLLAQFEEHEQFALAGELIILFSFCKERSFQKYNALAYKVAFLEAGHISQNLYLASRAIGLGCCGMGMNNGILKSEYLSLDPLLEPIFYGVAVGIPRRDP